MTVLFQPVDIYRDVPYVDTRRAETLAMSHLPTRDPNNPSRLPKDDPRYVDWRRRQAHGASLRPNNERNNAERRARVHAVAVKELGGFALIPQVMAHLETSYKNASRYLARAAELGLLTAGRDGKARTYRLPE